MARQPKAFLLGSRCVRNACASLLTIHSNGASFVALIFEASADIVFVAVVVGKVVLEVASAVGNDESRCAAHKEEKDCRELHDGKAVRQLRF